MFELILVLVLIGVALYFLPRIIPMDANIKGLIYAVVLIATLAYVYQHRAVLGV